MVLNHLKEKAICFRNHGPNEACNYKQFLFFIRNNLNSQRKLDFNLVVHVPTMTPAQ